MLPVGFEPTIYAGERPKTYALDRAATGTGNCTEYTNEKDKSAYKKIRWCKGWFRILLSLPAVFQVCHILEAFTKCRT